MRSLMIVAVLGLVAGLVGPVRAQEPNPAGVRPVVVIETTLGDITVELDPTAAPITVENFLRYVRAGFYDGTIFHRVIDNFVVQGGGYTQDLKQKRALYPDIKLESRNGLKNRRGTIAMVRGREPNSANCQFFINLIDIPANDYNPTTNPFGYAVFGHVAAGWETLDRIRQVKTVPSTVDVQADGNPAPTMPASPVVIRSIHLKDAGRGADAGR